MPINKKLIISFLSGHLIQTSFFIVVTLLFLTYAKLLGSDVLLDYDDKLLINAISNIHQLSDYWQGIKNGTILDLQPVRDLTYLFDLKLKAILPFHSFHLTNVLIWLLICLFFYGILRHETSNKHFPILLLFLYCFSPVSSSSVAWVAARKHLLSSLFILISTYLIIKNKRELFFNRKKMTMVAIFYLLSCLSQPINVLWPVWVLLYTYPQKDTVKRKWFLILLFLLMFIFVGTNYLYYSGTSFMNASAFGKFTDKSSFDIATFFLALGRYFYQCCFPFAALPVSHSQSAIENIVGLLGLMGFTLLFVFKEMKNKSSIGLPGLFFLLPLLVVTVKRTNIFCSDTYLLSASVGFYWALAELMSNLKNPRKYLVLLSVYCVYIFIYNLNYVGIFLNEKTLWQYSYEKEPTSHSTMIVALENLKEKKYQATYSLIDEIQMKWPGQSYLPQLITESIFFNDNIRPDKKIEIIGKVTPKTPAVSFYLSILYARNNQRQDLVVQLENLFNDPRTLKIEFGGREERVAAIYTYSCTVFKIQNCQDIKSLKEHIQKNNFDDKMYSGYLNYLLLNPVFRVDLKI